MKRNQNDYYDEYGDERPKRRKAMASAKAKKKKADHKHDYRDCALKYVGEDEGGRLYTLYSPARYCAICGKLECKWLNYTDMTKVNTKDVPLFEIEMWAKKVAI